MCTDTRQNDGRYPYLVALPKVGGRAPNHIGVDYECVVDVDEEGKLLLTTGIHDLHPLQLSGQVHEVAELGTGTHALVVHSLQKRRSLQ